jgi:hypothetical protein
MKTLKIFITTIALLLACSLQAQVVVHLNIGSPPPWGPSGYNEVNYYYLPDVEAYYDIHSSMFIYNSGGRWVHRKYLPRQYRNYDLYGGYKVVMTDYHGNTPYTHFKEYKAKYSKGYRGQPQKNAGERPGIGNSNKMNNRSNGRNAGHGQRMNSDQNRRGGKGRNK